MENKYFACVLICENKIFFVISDQTGEQLKKWETVSWRGRGCREVFLHIIGELAGVCESGRIEKVVLSLPCEVTKEGISRYCPSLGWGRVNLAKLWAENCSIPIEIVMRRNMLLLGKLREQHLEIRQDGAHRGAIFLGESLETSLLIDGKFIKDRQGSYSDLGRLPVRFESAKEKQTQIRLQEEISYVEMEKKYRKLKKEYEHVLPPAGAAGDIGRIAKTAKEGNPLAGKVVDEAAEAVVRAIACFSSVITLDCVLICGCSCEINELLKERIRFFAAKYGLETTLYYTAPTLETEILGCINFALFL